MKMKMTNFDEIILGEIYEVEVYDVYGDVENTEEYGKWYIELSKKQSENVISGFILSGINGMRFRYAELQLIRPTNIVIIDIMYFTLCISSLKLCYNKQNAAMLKMKNAAETVEN
jgi:hypothetical protein